MLLRNALILFTAGFFLLYGVAFSIEPVAMALLVTGSEPTGASALVDFRATYGGVNIALGLVIFYLHWRRQVEASLVMIAVLLSSMAITRAIGLTVEGQGNGLMYLYLALEVLGAVLAVLWLPKQNVTKE